MFESISNGISEFFSNVLPHEFCFPCFLKGLGEGLVIGGLALLAIAALPELAVVGAVLGILGGVALIENWTKMSDQQKSEAFGALLGGVVAGQVAGAAAEGAAADSEIISAEEANAPHVAAGRNPPYASGTTVEEYSLPEDQVYARVHGEDNRAGAWLMDPQDIEGLTPEQIQDKYALPETPTHVSDVNVPAGTTVREGTVGEQPGWGSGGGTQTELQDRLPDDAFTNTRPLK